MSLCDITALRWNPEKNELDFDPCLLEKDRVSVRVTRWGTRVVTIGDRECLLSTLVKEKLAMLKPLTADIQQHKGTFTRAVVLACAALPLALYERSETVRQGANGFTKICCMVQDFFRGVWSAVDGLKEWRRKMSTFCREEVSENLLRQVGQEGAPLEEKEDGTYTLKSSAVFITAEDAAEDLSQLRASVLQAEEFEQYWRDLAASEARYRS